MKSLVSPWLLGLIIAPLVRLWARTLRIERINTDVFTDPGLRARRPVIILWHDEIFPLIPSHEGEGMVCVVSQSSDGELLTQILRRFGFLATRGSSSRGGLRALIGARRIMDDQNVGAIFTVDGPRGPRHKVKPGAVFLAAQIGSPIVPVRAVMDRPYVFEKAWDKFQLPRLFSRCRIIYGQPLDVKVDVTSAEALEQQCRRLEEIMDNLERI